MAAPFALVMVLLCVALTKDLRNDPLVRRDQRSVAADRAGRGLRHQDHGEKFFFNVKPHEQEAGPRELTPARTRRRR